LRLVAGSPKKGGQKLGGGSQKKKKKKYGMKINLKQNKKQFTNILKGGEKIKKEPLTDP